MLEGFLGFEPRVFKLKLTMDYRVKTRLIWGKLGRASSLQVIPWHLCYNWGKTLNPHRSRKSASWHDSMCPRPPCG